MNDSLPILISLSIRILNLANLLKQEAESAQLAHDIQFRAELEESLGHLCQSRNTGGTLELLGVRSGLQPALRLQLTWPPCCRPPLSVSGEGGFCTVSF